LAASKLGPGGRQCAQALFPIAFESTSAEMVMGIDGSVAAFGAALALRARGLYQRFARHPALNASRHERAGIDCDGAHSKILAVFRGG